MRPGFEALLIVCFRFASGNVVRYCRVCHEAPTTDAKRAELARSAKFLRCAMTDSD